MSFPDSSLPYLLKTLWKYGVEEPGTANTDVAHSSNCLSQAGLEFEKKDGECTTPEVEGIDVLKYGLENFPLRIFE